MSPEHTPQGASHLREDGVDAASDHREARVETASDHRQDGGDPPAFAGDSAPSARGGNGAATAPRRAAARAMGAGQAEPPEREPGEDFFDYLLRPDVAPHVRSVSLVRVSTGAGGKSLRDPAIVFDHAPTLDEVFARISEPGYYEGMSRRSGGAFFVKIDGLLNITGAMLDAHRSRREDADRAAQEAASAAPPPPPEPSRSERLIEADLADKRQEIRELRGARDDDRQRHGEALERLTEANAQRLHTLTTDHAAAIARAHTEHAEQLAALKSDHADKLVDAKAATRDGTAMDGFRQAAEVFGGSSMDLKTSEAIRDKARAEGHTTGMVEGKAAAYGDARAAAREELSDRLEELDKRKAELERREAKHDKAIAGATDGATEREAELDAREAKLDGFEKQLGSRIDKYKAAVQQLGAARTKHGQGMRDLDAREADLAAREDTMMSIADPHTAAIAEGAMEVDPDLPYGGEFDDLLDDIGVPADAGGEFDPPPPARATPLVPATDPNADADADPLNPPTAEELELALGPD